MSSKRKGSRRQAPITWADVLHNPATPKPDPAADEQRVIDEISQRSHVDPDVVEFVLHELPDVIVTKLLEGDVVELGDVGSLSLIPWNPDDDSEDEVYEDADHQLYWLHFEPGKAQHAIVERMIARLARRN
jgi:hypothetical protein